MSDRIGSASGLGSDFSQIVIQQQLGNQLLGAIEQRIAALAATWSAGLVSTLNANLSISPAATLRVTPLAQTQRTPAAPTGTASAVQVMMGLAGTITPLVTGKALLLVSGTIFNASAIADGALVQIRYGTGATPANGDAATGTAVGGAVQYVAATTAEKAPFSLNAFVSGLTPATAYWIDVGLAAITGGTASISDVSISAVELE